MENLSPASAVKKGLQGIIRIGGQAGLIAINAQGRFSIMHTTDFMASGYAKGMRIEVQEGFQRMA